VVAVIAGGLAVLWVHDQIDPGGAREPW
jgi:hypothetical protein